MDDRPQVNAL
jgi:hypothetical protein